MLELDRLKGLQLARMDIDEMIALATYGRAVANGYAYYEVPKPKWLDESLQQLDKQILSRRREILEARLQEVRTRKEALKSREERRADLDAEEAALAAQLGTS